MRFGGVGLLAQTWANKLSPARAIASLLDSLLLGPDSRGHVLTWVGESVVFSHFAGPVAGRLERIAFVGKGSALQALLAGLRWCPFRCVARRLVFHWGKSRAKSTWRPSWAAAHTL